MKVVLVRKLANVMGGVDVAGHRVGDLLDVTPADARLLLAEEWATLDRRRECVTSPATDRRRTTCLLDDTRLERGS